MTAFMLNELLDRLVTVEHRLDKATQPDTSAADARDATATALADFGARISTLETTLATTASAADLAREQRLEILARSYEDALKAVVAESPNATIRTILRDQFGRATGIVEVAPTP